MNLELVHLLLPVHLDDQGDHKDEEGGAGDPGGSASAPEELLGDGRGLGGGELPAVNDGGLRDGAREPGEDTLAVAARPRERPPSTLGRRHRRLVQEKRRRGAPKRLGARWRS